jgi:hypothetical protein
MFAPAPPKGKGLSSPQLNINQNGPMKKLISLCCIMMVLCVGGATTGTVFPMSLVDVPTYSVGDFWTYWRIGSPENETVTVASTHAVSNNYSCYELHHLYPPNNTVGYITWCRIPDLAEVAENLWDPDSPLYFDPPVQNLDFPLYVGKRWNYTHPLYGIDDDGNLIFERNRTVRCFVVQEEDIDTAAGTLHCLRIVKNTDFGDYPDIWYSPRAGAIVKEGDLRILVAYSYEAGKAPPPDPSMARNSQIVLSLALILFAIDVIIPIYMIINNRKRPPG